MSQPTKKDDGSLHERCSTLKQRPLLPKTETIKTNMSATHAKILDLPLELRLRIFGHLFASEYYISDLKLKLVNFDSSSSRLWVRKRTEESENANKHPLALFRTNRQINAEATNVFYARKFIISLEELTYHTLLGWQFIGSLKDFSFGPHIQRMRVEILVGVPNGCGYKLDRSLAISRTRTLVRAAKRWASLYHLEIVINTFKGKRVSKYLSELIPILEGLLVRGSVKVSIKTRDRHYNVDSVSRALEQKMKVVPQTRYNLRSRIGQLSI